MSRTIEIHRHYNLLEMNQDDPEVKAWLGESYKPLGPYFENRATATGLTFEEQKLLLPKLLGIEATDKDFRRAVTKFYDELLTTVPKNGLKLEIGLTDDSQPLSDDNLPISLKEYIVYRHAIGNQEVAKDSSEAGRYSYKRYYIVDPNKVHQEQLNTNKIGDQAMTLYFRYKDDKIKVDQILTMMGVDIRKLKKDQKSIELRKFASIDPKLSESQQTEQFKRFMEVCEDADLEMKFLIQELIGAQYLEKVGTNILIKESGEKLGDDMKDAVLFLKNNKNSKVLNLLKASYQTKVKDAIKEVLQVTQVESVAS